MPWKLERDGKNWHYRFVDQEPESNRYLRDDPDPKPRWHHWLTFDFVNRTVTGPTEFVATGATPPDDWVREPPDDYQREDEEG